MKHTLRKITVFTVICLFMAVTGCQEDLPEKDPQGITPKSSSEVSYLTEQETADAVAMYNNQLSKATRAINFTFDGKDMMMLPDQFSKKQYTFMVQHENDSELVFHNVVITDWDGYKKTMLVKYEMTEDFAEKFANGLVGFDDFTGNVTYELLTADEEYPCGETPGAGIPISGGNGPGGGSSGGSGYGSGQPWNPSGNGNPYNQDAVNDRFLMMEMEYMSAQFNQPLYAHQSPRNIGEIDRITPEPYSFIPSIDDTTNPCGEGDEIGILLPMIQNLINKPCQKAIIDNVLAVSSPFTNIIKQTFDTNENVNLRINNINLPEGAAAVTSFLIQGTPENYTINMAFDNSYLNNATNLSIAAIFLHELVHAYLIDLYLKDMLIAESDDYETLLNAFINFYADSNQVTYNELDNELHNAMADFIQKMANSLYNYANSQNIAGVTPDYCIALAWSTMNGYDLYQNVLTPQQQNDYAEIGNNEQESTNDKKGNKCSP